MVIVPSSGTIAAACSKIFKAIRPSPLTKMPTSSSTSSVTCKRRLPRPTSSSVIARRKIWPIAFGVKASNVMSRKRDKSGLLTSKNGFSVVAPMRIIVPSSTQGNNTSCWLLLKRWISSRNNIVLCCNDRTRLRASSMMLRNSPIPALVAFKFTKWLLLTLAMIPASVVFPVPQGP